MDVQVERRGRAYWASIDGGPAFFVGRRVRFGDRAGLCNMLPGVPAARPYAAQNYQADFGFWATFIAPIIACEGGCFTAVNSYDRARFTFGAAQFAAHVPDGDFVRLFRRLLALPDAARYFPMLGLVGGRICRLAPDMRPIALENARSSLQLALFLNPKGNDIDPAEVATAARLIHWTDNVRAARIAQVAQMVQSCEEHMRRAAQHLPLQGRSAAQCCVLADLMHHGRAGAKLWALAADALCTADPFKALLSIGAGPWSARTRTLEKAINAAPSLSSAHWDVAQRQFVQ